MSKRILYGLNAIRHLRVILMFLTPFIIEAEDEPNVGVLYLYRSVPQVVATHYQITLGRYLFS